MPISKLDRTIISVAGETARAFLDGLITNNLENDMTFAALLTPQGKIIADFFVHKKSDQEFLIETPVKFGKTLLMRLKMYKLRAKIELEDISGKFEVYTFWDGEGDVGGNDPRHPKLGQRLLAKSGSLSPEHEPADYDAHRLELGIPESEWDFETEKFFPADARMDLLNGVDFKKGCFVGQEVVSRMHRKTEVRKRMGVIELSGSAQTGDELKSGGRTLGRLLHVNGNKAMALLRLDRIAEATDAVTVNDKEVTIEDV